MTASLSLKRYSKLLIFFCALCISTPIETSLSAREFSPKIHGSLTETLRPTNTSTKEEESAVETSEECIEKKEYIFGGGVQINKCMNNPILIDINDAPTWGAS